MVVTMLGRCMTALLVRRGAGRQAALLSTWPAGWPCGLTTTTPSEAADSRGYAATPGAVALQGGPRTPDHRPDGGGGWQGDPQRQLWAHISRQQGGERCGSSWQTALGASGLQVLPATQGAVATRGAIKEGEEVVGARKPRRGWRCQHPQGCDTLPSFGYPGERPQYCRAHAQEWMEDVRNKRCEHAGCRTHPCYGHPGERPQYCRVHAQEGMEDVKSKLCEHVGCKTQPYYGHPGERAQYCKAHALEGMEDVKNRRCEQAGCKTQPHYGNPGGRALFCKVHALVGMVSIWGGGR